MTEGPALAVRGLTAGYGGVAVVRNVDLEVSAGEIVGLLGANGAGKTTTLLAISGVLRAMAGQVDYGGRDLVGVSAHKVARLGLAHVPEDRSLFFGLSVQDHIKLATRGSGGLDAFELFPALRRLRRRKAGLLSGGEQQMLALARALVAEPKVLLVDEMSLGLAPVIVERLFETLKQIAHETKLAVLLVEQHVHMALRHADRGYIMAHGEVVTDGVVADLAQRWDEIEASYLGHALTV